MLTLVNCFTEEVDVMFDGQHYIFQPGDEMTLPDEVGRHLRMKSMIHDNPVTGKGVFALHYKDRLPSEPPKRMGPELLDRSDMAEIDRKITYQTLNNPVDIDPGKTRSALDSFREGPENGAAVRAGSRPVA